MLAGSQCTASSEFRNDGTTVIPDPCPLAERAWREQMVKEAAYFRFLHRGCRPGQELDDWLAAEHDVEAFLFMPMG